ncbi:MAG: phosphate propanoyltransferase [Candidatus Muirbacterium halophilum]|nr:phosphate propanoyltransferase [Candidatus Muirbacterium halophilum]MCK9475285.1 phosphate propanoyltransferase [Candidatus Muirbacterium halophilum]
MDKNEIADIVRSVVGEYRGDENEKYNNNNKKVSLNSFPVSVSNRHIHICKSDLECIFGKGYELKRMKELSQPGQFACEEKVIIVGPKGSIENVRILGPERKETQVEISVTDTFKLGIPVFVRDSGDLSGTPGLTVCGPKGSVYIEKGAIVAKRHIHFSENDAKKFNVKDKEKVNVLIEGEKGGIFSDVLVRVSNSYALDMHIDTDEGNAFGIGRNTKGQIS